MKHGCALDAMFGRIQRCVDLVRASVLMPNNREACCQGRNTGVQFEEFTVDKEKIAIKAVSVASSLLCPERSLHPSGVSIHSRAASQLERRDDAVAILGNFNFPRRIMT